jgi:hypothetical protein
MIQKAENTMTNQKAENALRLDIPPDLHPEVIRGNHIECHSDVLNTARGAMSNLYGVWAKINDIAGRVDNKALLASKAQDVIGQALEATDRQRAELLKRREYVARRVERTIRPPQQDPAASEIRQCLRQQKNPSMQLSNLVKQGDRRSVAAALSAPPYLSGLSQEQQQAVEQQARHAFAPDEQGLMEDIDSAVWQIDHAASKFRDELGSQIAAWRNKDHELLQELAKPSQAV